MSPSGTGISYYRSVVKLADITDGASNTYMLGEKYLDPDYYLNGLDYTDLESMYGGWNDDIYRGTYYSGENTNPISDPTPETTPLQDQPGLFQDSYRFGSAHANSCNMAFCDGSVTPINYSINAHIHCRLGNRQDGRSIDSNKR